MKQTKQMTDYNLRVEDSSEEVQDLEYVSKEGYQNIQEFRQRVRADSNVSNQRITYARSKSCSKTTWTSI
jgi:hypothetical protein